MDMPKVDKETIKVEGEKLLDKVKELIKEGNVRRVVIKNEAGESLIEIPMTFAAIGVLAAPVVAAVGAVAALLTNVTLEIERTDSTPSTSSGQEGSQQADSSTGSTNSQQASSEQDKTSKEGTPASE